LNELLLLPRHHAGEHIVIENNKGRKATKGPIDLKMLEVTTGGTVAGKTISTGLEIQKSNEVKEVKEGCCTLL